MSIFGFIYEMITVCFIKRKGINSHFCHLKFHCIYDMLRHCRRQSSTLRDNNKMKLYKFKTMTYGKHSMKYVAGNLWNNINVDIKIQTM